MFMTTHFTGGGQEPRDDTVSSPIHSTKKEEEEEERRREDSLSLLSTIPSLGMADSILTYLFDVADKDKSGSLSKEEVIDMVQYLKLPFSNGKISRMFLEYDTDCSGHLSRLEFQQFVYLLIAELFHILIKGEIFYKYDRYGHTHKVLVTLDKTCKYITWEQQSFFFPCCIPSAVRLLDIENNSPRIETGQVTYKFSRRSPTITSITTPRKSTTFSIIYFRAGKERSLDLIAPSKHTYTMWCKALEILLKGVSISMENVSLSNRYLKYMFETADADNSGCLSTKEICNLVQQMGVSTSPNEILQQVRETDADGSGELDRDEFAELLQRMSRRIDLFPLWNSIVHGKYDDIKQVTPLSVTDMVMAIQMSVTIEDLTTFWRVVQGTELNKDMLSMDFTLSYPNGRIEFKDFVVFMTSIDNLVINPLTLTNMHDMTQSISHYYISSSHNTYLEGDQWTSNSSVKRYIDDLLNNVRCIEIDTWDGSTGEPEVTHGHTLTSAILLRDVLIAIQRYAFITSSYPLIISLDNHCSIEQQRKIVMLLKDTFKETLLLPCDIYEENYIMLLQSPEELQGKIIIKGVRHKTRSVIEMNADTEGRLGPVVGEIGDTDDDDDDMTELDEEEIDATSANGNHSFKKQNSVFGAFGRLSSMHHVRTDNSLCAVSYLRKGKDDLPSDEAPSDSVRSYKENRMKKLIADPDSRERWLVVNRKYLSRVYPNAIRIDSSNYNPLEAWGSGVQLAALNTQTPGIPLMLHQGLFRINRGCGYVLKPSYLSGNVNSSMMTSLRLKVNIISGQSLPAPDNSTMILSPKIEVSVHEVSVYGVLTDTVMLTSTVKSNGFDPIWNEVFEFNIENLTLAQISFRCFHEIEQSNPVACASYLVNTLRPGYRGMPLFDPMGKCHSNYAFATLFLHIGMEYSTACDV